MSILKNHEYTENWQYYSLPMPDRKEEVVFRHTADYLHREAEYFEAQVSDVFVLLVFL